MPCHGVELGVLAGKLCVPDAQTSNTVYVPTPHRHHTLCCPDIVMVYLMYVDYLRQDHIICVLYTPEHVSQSSQAMLCHGFEPGVLAGKLCVRDAQVSNAVYVPTPPYVMSLSQASWQGSCASGTHRCPTLSTFPRHILTTHCFALPCNEIYNDCWLSI